MWRQFWWFGGNFAQSAAILTIRRQLPVLTPFSYRKPLKEKEQKEKESFPPITPL